MNSHSVVNTITWLWAVHFKHGRGHIAASLEASYRKLGLLLPPKRVESVGALSSIRLESSIGGNFHASDSTVVWGYRDQEHIKIWIAKLRETHEKSMKPLCSFPRAWMSGQLFCPRIRGSGHGTRTLHASILARCDQVYDTGASCSSVGLTMPLDPLLWLDNSSSVIILCIFHNCVLWLCFSSTAL